MLDRRRLCGVSALKAPLMADSQSQVFDVNLTGGVVTMSDFDPLRGDQLDFGDISVHGLILGQLADGTAIITSPWSTSNYIVLEGVRWTDLTAANFVPVGNEHLRQDIGAVLSWEQDLGPRDSDTVYLRSHEYGVQERVENFDPQTQKLNFLYLGTRERLSVEDTSEGLLISTEPSGQSLLLVGVLRTDLVAANLEFHHDQVMEDNLEEPFGFSQDAVSLVSRQELFTPPAPEGDSTDGLQVRSGESVQAAPEVVITEVDHSSHGHDHVMGDHGVMEAMAQPTEALMLSVSGSLYWGGMGGTLTVANGGDQAVEDWSVSFLTRHQDFQSWAGDVAVVELEPGLYEVSLTPASWNNSIAAGGSLSIDFNATSVGLPNAGALTSELFFAADPNTAMAAAAPEPAGDSVEVVEPVASPQ
ncbi:MAG TPA: 1,4-beta-glucanase, partial [Synechococcales bacterium UBA12195]|nr:1,4-beta-glucanase [Synechococcales bacterium UBA12195]